MCQTTILPQSLDECIRGSVNASAKNDYGGFDEFMKMAMNENEYTCEKDARVMQIIKKNWHMKICHRVPTSILNTEFAPPPPNLNETLSSMFKNQIWMGSN